MRAPVSGGTGAGDKYDTDLTAGAEEVDHLLHRARAVHVERDVDEILRDGLADKVALLVRAVLEELLAQVVAEGICGRGCGPDQSVERAALTDK